MGMKIGEGGQFDMLKKVGCELNPTMPPEVIFRQWGCVEVQVLKSVIPIICHQSWYQLQTLISK